MGLKNRFLCWFFVIGFTFGCFQATYSDPLAVSKRQVQSDRDYADYHMPAHILRLVGLGLELYREFPDQFPNIDEHLIILKLALHDQSKINREKEFLRRFRMQQRRDQISYRLYTMLYNRSVSNLSGEERTAAEELISEFNGIDGFIGHAFYQWKNLIFPDGSLKPAAQQLDRIERITDAIDRELDSISSEELGRIPWPAERDKAVTSADRLMVQHLRLNYHRVTAGITFHDAKSNKLRTPTPHLNPERFSHNASRICVRLLGRIQFPTPTSH